MRIDVIRKKLAEKLKSSDTYNIWIDILQHTNPANYGVEDIEINIDFNDIWVEVREKTFAFKKSELIFNARLGGSGEESGYDASFRIGISGNGQFEFTNKSQDISIVSFDINEDLDLYPDRE